jgi:hypothetical protein
MLKKFWQRLGICLGTREIDWSKAPATPKTRLVNPEQVAIGTQNSRSRDVQPGDR